MSHYSCCVCLLECEYLIKCSSRCNAVSCFECLSTMISYYEFSIKCPECNSFYYHRELKTLDNNNNKLILNIKEYETKLLKTITKTGEDELNTYILENKIINMIRNDRKLYIGHTFPKAIQLMIDICYAKDMKKVNKDNIKIAMKYKPKMTCKHILCKGVMTQYDNKLKCDYCKSEVCIECEKPYIENHECLQADIDSINMMKTYIKCPECNIPVEKIDGCNNMTCGICNTNFDYITGDISRYGSHNRTPIKLKETKSIFDLLTREITDVNVINTLKKIESMKPKPPKIEIVYKAITTQDREIFKKFDAYLQNSILYKKYIAKVNLIINLDKSETLTLDNISAICYDKNNKML